MWRKQTVIFPCRQKRTNTLMNLTINNKSIKQENSEISWDIN